MTSSCRTIVSTFAWVTELKGNNTAITKEMISTRGALADGVLTPGDKGKIVAANEEWKYAIVEFSDEFMVELIGPERNQALPQAEVMVRRASIEDPDQAFVTRLRLRQAIREKNLVIADILSDWQQKPVEVGDLVFN